MDNLAPLGSNPATAILVDDDDDLQDDKDRKVNTIQRARKNPAGLQSTHTVISLVKEEVDLSDGDYEQAILAEEDLVKEIKYVDLTDNRTAYPLRGRSASAAAEPAQDRSLELEIPQLTLANGEILGKDSIIELKEPEGRFRIEFVKIQAIIKSTYNGRVKLRGWPYTRAKCLDGQLLRKLNEVCLVGHIDEEDPRPWIEQALIDVYESDVVRVRCGLRTTNAPFPQLRFEDSVYAQKGKKWVEHNEHLVCRYHHYLIYRDVTRKKLQKAHQWVLVHVNEDMADPEHTVRDVAKTNNWRGGKIAGGSFSPLGSEPEVVHVDDDEDDDDHHQTALGKDKSNGHPEALIPRSPGQKYTVGDVFSGTGGASRGIQQAGFKLVFAVDHWRVATTSYRANFPDVNCYQMEVDDFVSSPTIRYRVDILHLSPPCQVWSPAHTIPGQNDDKNMAALLSCSEVINKIRPRVFTLEQTFGMLHARFELYFNGLVGGFTDHGYSVRWGVINFNTWGLCQPRRRLVMVGACPGESLPDFPKATHSLDGAGGLQPLTTARQALAHLRPGENLHHPNDMPRLLNAQAWDPDTPLPRTITCSGGQNYHWNGERDFTIREYATLQGFPGRHRFRGSYLKRQIGNAFPPSMAQKLFAHLRDFLERVDRMIGPRLAEHPYIPGREIVDLDEIEVDGKLQGSLLNPEQETKWSPRPIELRDDSDDVMIVPSQTRRQSGAGCRIDYPIALDDVEEGDDIPLLQTSQTQSINPEMKMADDRSDSHTVRADDDRFDHETGDRMHIDGSSRPVSGRGNWNVGGGSNVASPAIMVD